jgi:hypothetical protein
MPAQCPKGIGHRTEKGQIMPQVYVLKLKDPDIDILAAF